MRRFFSKLSAYTFVLPIAFFLSVILIVYLLFAPYIRMASDFFSVFMPAEAAVQTMPPVPEKTILPAVTIPSETGGETPRQTVKLSSIDFPEYQEYYAQLTCEEIGLSVKVFWGDTNEVLRKGVGQSLSSFYPGFGKPLLMGGHNKSFLSSLANVAPGQVFKLTTSYGEFTYTITGTKITSAEDKSAYDLTQQKEQLILYTCYPLNAYGVNAKRLFIYGDKTAGPEIVD